MSELLLIRIVAGVLAVAILSFLIVRRRMAN